MIAIISWEKRTTTICGCGRQASPKEGWKLFISGRPACQWCSRRYQDETQLARTLDEKLPVAQFGGFAFIINGAGECGNTVCRIDPHSDGCNSKPEPRRIEVSTSIPVGAQKPTIRCPRCIVREFPQIDAVLRQIMGQPAAEPEPAPAPPPEPTAEEIRATRRHRMLVGIAQAIDPRFTMAPLERAETILAAIECVSLDRRELPHGQ